MSSQLGGMRVTLERIRDEIRQVQLGSAAAGKSKRLGDPEQETFWRRLGRYEADLRRIQRDLLSRLNMLQQERANLWNVPRDRRYSTRQSVDDREVITQDLVTLAHPGGIDPAKPA